MNAFKPGTAEQVRQLLAIADAAPHHTIAAHSRAAAPAGITPGRTSRSCCWRPTTSCAGERTCSCARAAASVRPSAPPNCCTGRGRSRTARRSMPVDAVLVGTAAMAVLESAASPQVKRALVAAGGADGWVPRRGVEGGVTSARCEPQRRHPPARQRASRAGHLLESVAGDEAAVLARRDEIVAALAQTAKPYIGDVDGDDLPRAAVALPRALRDGRASAATTTAPGGTRAGVPAPWRCSSVRRRGWRGEAGPIAFSLDLDDPAEALREFALRTGGGDDAAAPRRCPVLPRGLRLPGQARAVRAGAGRRGPPLVHGRRPVAGAGRSPRRRRGLRHPRPRGRGRHHPRRRAGRRAARPLRGGRDPRVPRRRSARAARRARAGARAAGELAAAMARSPRSAPPSASSARTVARGRIRSGG